MNARHMGVRPGWCLNTHTSIAVGRSLNWGVVKPKSHNDLAIGHVETIEVFPYFMKIVPIKPGLTK